MKKSLLKFLPLMAAVLLATSCKKDDDNNAPANGRDGVHTVSTSTIPFSIKVNTGNSLKKVGYEKSTEENKKGYYSVFFDKDDYAKKLKMVIKTDDKEFGELTLQDDLVTFSGDLRVFPEEGDELTAVVTIDGKEGSEAFSDESLEDLFKTCAHTYEGKFKFTYADKDANVTLTDQNVYLAIAMSPCCDHKITINNDNFTVQSGTVQAGRIWIAVPAKDGVKSKGLGKEINEEAKNITPGLIHNVIRQYFTVWSDGNKVKRVHFSKGNLQYNPKPPTGEKNWRFAENQWDYCIENIEDFKNKYYVQKTSDWIDLFGWGMWLNGQDPLRTAVDGDYFYQSNNKVGKDEDLPDNAIIGSEWTLLSAGENGKSREWNYLMGWLNQDGRTITIDNTKITAAQLYGLGSIIVSGNKTVKGLILLPDDWIYPDLSTSSTQKAAFKTGNSAWENTYTTGDWKLMEANGAVFLPAAGMRSTSQKKIYQCNETGRYWSLSGDASDNPYAFALYFGIVRNSPSVQFNEQQPKDNGLSVRLVRVLN